MLSAVIEITETEHTATELVSLLSVSSSIWNMMIENEQWN